MRERYATPHACSAPEPRQSISDGSIIAPGSYRNTRTADSAAAPGRVFLFVELDITETKVVPAPHLYQRPKLHGPLTYLFDSYGGVSGRIEGAGEEPALNGLVIVKVSWWRRAWCLTRGWEGKSSPIPCGTAHRHKRQTTPLWQTPSRLRCYSPAVAPSGS